MILLPPVREGSTHLAAIEATQRGHGGITYIAAVLSIQTRRIERGIEELDHLEDDPAAGRIRRPGAGRLKDRFRNAEEKNLIQCIEFRTAGDPDEEDIVQTDLSPQDLSEPLSKMGTSVGKDTIAQWLDDTGIRRRQICKDIPRGEHPDRDRQFEQIAKTDFTLRILR